jgi:hypothetical protein
MRCLAHYDDNYTFPLPRLGVHLDHVKIIWRVPSTILTSRAYALLQVNAHLPSDDPDRVRANLEEALKSGALEKQLAAIGLPLVPGSFKVTVSLPCTSAYPRRYCDDPGRYRDDPRRYRDDPGRYRDDPGRYRDDPGRYRDDPGRYRDDPRRYRDDEVADPDSDFFSV